MAHKIFRSLFVLLLVIGSVVVPTPSPARAAGPWYVTATGDDNNDCLNPGTACATINATIGKAADGDIIYLGIGTYTDIGSDVARIFGKALAFSGGWNADFTSQSGMSIIDGQGVRAGITTAGIYDGMTISIDHLIVQNGTSGIYTAGIWTVNDSIIRQNSGIGVWITQGDLTLNNSTVTGNGQGITGQGNALVVSNSIISENTGRGISYSGLFSPSLTITNSSISRNAGGGIDVGGSVFSSTPFSLSNSTIANNTTDAFSFGGGIHLSDSYEINLTINNSTVSGNSSSTGGGIYNVGANNTVTMLNTILAGNTASTSGPDCAGTITTSDHNIISSTSGCTLSAGTGDQFDVNPLISAYPMGTSGYFTLLANSPAIDSGNPATCLPIDQRGMARPQGSICDIGAYEYVASPGTATSFGYLSGSNQRTTPGSAFPNPFVVYTLDSNGSAVPGVSVTFTAPSSGPGGTFTDSGTNITTALSDSSGVAISSAFTANSQPGGYEVIATASGLTDSVPFALTNAAWFVALSGNDSNTCNSPTSPCLTINAAVDKAAAGETIFVASGTYTGTSDFVVNINKNITLSGSWDPSFTSRGTPSVIDGQGARSGIYVNQAITTIEYFNVKNGFACSGGGILNYGSLTLLNSAITNNRADNPCGAGGGGIWSYGTLILRDTTISDNLAIQGGGLYISGGSADLNNVNISNNTSNREGGAAYVYGFGANPSAVTINHSVVSHNIANYDGGGFYLYQSNLTVHNSSITGNLTKTSFTAGGGVFISDGSLIVNNSTISGNNTYKGGGIYLIGSNAAHAYINNSTIADNIASIGGGVINDGNNSTFTFRNSILAQNTGSTDGPDCIFGPLSSGGYNILGSTVGCNFNSTSGDLTNVDPLLGSLVGIPGYHSLLQSSPAIDAGNPAGCTDQDGNLLNSDQRSVERVGTCDIGAYEYTTPGPAASLSLAGGDNQSTATNSAFPNPLQAAALDSQGSPVSGVSIDFTAPASGPSGTFADTGTNTASIVTDEGGVAITSVFTANNQVGTYTVSASAGGLGSINFNLKQVARPNNDSFANAEAIASLPFLATLDISEATTEPNEPQSCASTERTVWYKFTPSATATLSTDTHGSLGPNVSIYRAGGPGISGLQFVQCTSPGGAATFFAESGQTYYIQVGAPNGGNGTVLFNLSEIPAISGRVTNALTGTPLSGSAYVTLQRVCGDGCFQFISSSYTNGDGRFRFDSYFGNPLPAGTYQIEVSASQYQTKRFGPFEFSDASLDVGDLAMDPLPLIGSISGRLMDNTTRKPVSPTFNPSVQLYRCHDGNCYEYVNSQIPDALGQFRFETDYGGNRLLVGTYQVVAVADQYNQVQTQPFLVGEGENKNLGNLRITSLPVRFSEAQPCADIPASGGQCVFTVRITNGMATSLKGSTWSLADSNLPYSFAGYTDFQIKEAQSLNLDPGKSRVFRFQFNVPANIGPDGSSICTRIFVGQGSNSFFNTIGYRNLFCVFRYANGFSVAPQVEMNSAAQSPSALAAAATDIEPNNSCQSAQDIGAFTESVVVDGNLDSSVSPDIDFYRFTGTAGATVIIDHEGASTSKGTLVDPVMGFFDSNCNLLAMNDDSGSLNSHLEIAIPPDGIFIVAATSYPDYGFTGGGFGTYQLTIAPVETIGSISGRVTDSVTRKGLRGDVAPFSFVRLLKCDIFGCNDVSGQMADSTGRFSFNTDFYGVPLQTGDYILIASADQYQTTQSEIFHVGKDENYNAGNVALTSYPVRFSEVKACTVPVEGGLCDFSVKITNGLAVPLSGKSWSIVSGSGIGSITNFTAFQPDLPIDARLNPGKSSVLHFRFYVRGSVANGATLCATVYVGQGSHAFFNTVGQSSLFCFVKGTNGFTLMPALDAQTASQQMQIQDQVQPNALQTEKKK